METGLDIVIGIIGIASLSVLAYLGGSHLGRTSSRRRPWLFVESILFCLVFAWTLDGKLHWALAIPLSCVIYWSNFMPLLLGFTAGLASWSPGMGEFRRPVVVGLLIFLAIGYMLAPVARPLFSPVVVDTQGSWARGVCLQSHPSTCAAASAATLLKHVGIETNEWEMSAACLTSQAGTVPLGLYRGLAMKANANGFDAEVASSQPSEWLKRGQMPNVALLRFQDQFHSTPANRFMGPRSEGHVVVVLGRSCDGRWIIGDPAVGRLHWSDEEFRSYFTGDAIFLKATR